MILAVALALLPAAHAGAVVSEFKAESRQGANTYNAQAAIDGKLDTVWQLPGESKNVGEYIILDVPKTTLDKVAMVIGWGDSEERFHDYARVKSIKIEASAYDENNDLQPVGTTTATFPDAMGWQVVDVEDIVIGTDLFGGKVKITITEVYPGKDYPNLAISEVLLHMAELHSPMPKIIEVSSEDSAHLGADMGDDDDKTFWVGDAANASVTFQAEGFSLSSVALKPVSKEYDRPKRVRVTANSRSVEVDLADKLELQWVQIPAIVGFTGSAWGEVQLEVLETYAGSKYPGKLGVKELDVKATSFEG
ncbi:discoidin domain-containing protein [Myxococcota bacterium]|nr:discoidin domain-containing protein [Myxococcota bacterium]